MRKILVLVLIVLALFTGYWYWSAQATERAVTAWVEAREAEGWQAEYSNITTRGYPLNFVTVIEDPRFADPATGLAYSAPSLTFERQSFKPTEIVARFDDTSTISTPYETITLTKDLGTALLYVEPSLDLRLIESSVTFDNLTASSTNGWDMKLDGAQFTTVRDADDPLTHEISFVAEGLEPPAEWVRRFDDSALLSDRFDLFDMQLTATFDRPWDITALQGPRPQPSHVEIEKIAARWGMLDLMLAGELDVGPDGTPTGTVSIKAQNWREMLELAVDAGAIPEKLRDIAFGAGKMLAGLSGNTDTIDADLTLRDGKIYLGFIPLGPAPNLSIR